MLKFEAYLNTGFVQITKLVCVLVEIHIFSVFLVMETQIKKHTQIPQFLYEVLTQSVLPKMIQYGDNST